MTEKTTEETAGETCPLYCTVILWDLSRSQQTVASLRSYLRDYAVEAYAKTPGLRQKVWISSTGPEGEQWGAVYLWDTEEAAYGRPPGVSKVVELIGYRPPSAGTSASRRPPRARARSGRSSRGSGWPTGRGRRNR